MKPREYHGMRHTPEYEVWKTMIQRCHNPNSKKYADYGARGVSVCQEWRDSFLAFITHVGRRPNDRMSIDRIDVNGNYEPGNCRWVDSETQARNVRLRSTNKSGIRGVWWMASRTAWVVKIHVKGRVLHVGQVKDFFEACCLRKSAELSFHS